MQTGGTQQSSGAKLRGRIGRGDGFVALRLDGIIDEHNGLDHWLAAVGEGHTLLVDLGGVKRLNSVGVRDWVNWLRALRPRWQSIVLFDCPPPVMNEVNFIKNFAEGALITTFVAPLFCTQCKKEDSRLLDALDLKKRGGTLPSFRCDRGDCENALDDDEASYTSFLSELPSAPDAERMVQLTALARDVLKAEALRSMPLDAANNASPVRANALAQVGIAGQPAHKPIVAAGVHGGGAAMAGLVGHGTAHGSGAQAGGGASSAAAAATPVAAPGATTTTPKKGKAGSDWLFVGAITAMVAVLGVLIYLLMTLE